MVTVGYGRMPPFKETTSKTIFYVKKREKKYWGPVYFNLYTLLFWTQWYQREEFFMLDVYVWWIES